MGRERVEQIEKVDANGEDSGKDKREMDVLKRVIGWVGERKYACLHEHMHI